MNTTKLLEEYFSRAELAHALDISVRTIGNYVNEPDGLPYLEVGGRQYFHPDSTIDWLKRRRTRRLNPRRRKAGDS